MATPLTNYFIMQKYNRTGHQYEDGQFTEAFPIEMERVEFPFPGDTTNFLIHQNHCQKNDWYLEKVPTPGTPNPKYPDLYYIEDGQMQAIGGGYSTFERTWGLLPGFNGEKIGEGSNYVRRECESYSWERPGVDTTDKNMVQWGIDNASSLPTQNANSITLYTQVDIYADPSRYVHDVVSPDYDMVTVAYQGYNTVNGVVYTKDYLYTTDIISRTSTSITVAPAPFNDSAGSAPLTYNWFSRPQYKREPSAVILSSFVYYDYYLPGLNCSGPEDIPLVDVFTVYDEHGNPTQYLTQASDPTLSEFHTLIDAGELQCVEGSVVRRWRGNIYERATRYAVLK